MASCPKCQDFIVDLRFDQPREYLGPARQLLNLVNDGAFVLTESTCPLQDLFKSQWPSDVVEHNFECTSCGRSFQLFADTFHGFAGWGLTGPPRQLEPEPTSHVKTEVGSWF